MNIVNELSFDDLSNVNGGMSTEIVEGLDRARDVINDSWEVAIPKTDIQKADWINRYINKYNSSRLVAEAALDELISGGRIDSGSMLC